MCIRDRAWAKEAGVTLYLDADVQYAYSNSLFDSLNLSRDVSSLLTKDRGIDYPYDRVTYQLLNTADSFRYILNPAAVDTAFQKTTALLDNLGFDGVSLRYAGTNANADYKENRLVERQTAMKRLTANVKSMAESRTVSTPVSYTHLDVYKRQHLYHQPGIGGQTQGIRSVRGLMFNLIQIDFNRYCKNQYIEERCGLSLIHISSSSRRGRDPSA